MSRQRLTIESAMDFLASCSETTSEHSSVHQVSTSEGGSSTPEEDKARGCEASDGDTAAVDDGGDALSQGESQSLRAAFTARSRAW